MARHGLLLGSLEGVYRFRKTMSGLFAVLGHAEATQSVYLGLYALQHRGETACGIASRQRGLLQVHCNEGHVADVFDEAILTRLAGDSAIGHVCFPVQDQREPLSYEPLLADAGDMSVAVAFQGRLTNGHALRNDLLSAGAALHSQADSEVVAHLLATPASHLSSAPLLADRVGDATSRMEGAYTFLALTPTAVCAVRDPLGFWPLMLGKVGDSWLLASETCALDLLGGVYVRDIEPGETLIFDLADLRQPSADHRMFGRTAQALCSVEWSYYARPDSLLLGHAVEAVRSELGRILAREGPAVADVVVFIPDTGLGAAKGYSDESGIRLVMGLYRKHYIGRLTLQHIRHFGPRSKLEAVRAAVEGMRVVLVDDNIVGGGTARQVIAMLRAAGAREVHLRIASPKTQFRCPFGFGMPPKEGGVRLEVSLEMLQRHVGADSLVCLSIESFRRALAVVARSGSCDYCLTGEEPSIAT